MNNNIKYLVEDYFTNTEQLTNTMKNTTKASEEMCQSPTFPEGDAGSVRGCEAETSLE